MGIPGEPKPAKFFVALLAADAALLVAVEKDLVAVLGNVDDRSSIVPWTVSNYYKKEMGHSLFRCFLSFEQLRAPDRLADTKLQTQKIEERYRRPGVGGRCVNLDPGYLDAFKVVLASTKNAGQRIYLGSGIYAEATLQYHDGAFHGRTYTYRDYLWPETLMFLTRMRSTYLGRLKPVD
jgi:hypothetical protein